MLVPSDKVDHKSQIGNKGKDNLRTIQLVQYSQYNIVSK